MIKIREIRVIREWLAGLKLTFSGGVGLPGRRPLAPVSAAARETFRVAPTAQHTIQHRTAVVARHRRRVSHLI